MLATATCTAAEAPRRPNVLWIITDQQPIATVGAYGSRLAQTPNIDRLAREGMRFEGFYVSSFPCSPSRACYFTGRYAHRHGVVTNDVPLRADLPSLGTIFRAAGYQTAYVGKWHLGGNMYAGNEAARWSNRVATDPDGFHFTKDGPWRGGEDEPQCGFVNLWVGGWTHYHRFLEQSPAKDLLEAGRFGNHNIAPSGPEGTHIYSKLPSQYHVEAFLGQTAEKFIRHGREPDKPFCMVLSFYGPHLPVAPPRPWDLLVEPRRVTLPDNHADALLDQPAARRDGHCYRLPGWNVDQFRDYIARYHGYCAYIDQQIGKVLKALDELKLAGDTIVILTTDHGDMLASHGSVFKMASGYDELMRVPFVVRYPPVVQANRSNTALVESVDTLPTLLDLCGLAPPGDLDGRSFRAVLEGRRPALRDHVVTSMHGTIAIADRDYKLVYTFGRGTARAFIELYDLHEKPLEVHNRAGDGKYGAVLTALKNRLRDWLRATRHPHADRLASDMSGALTRSPRPEELVFPRIAEFRQTQDAQNQPAAEFDVEWQVGSPLSTSEKYWCFIHLLGKDQREILSRATRWPSPPTTVWQVGQQRRVGPLVLPVPQGLSGKFDLRVGLFNPDNSSRPDTPGDASRIVGALNIIRDADGKTRLEFQPSK